MTDIGDDADDPADLRRGHRGQAHRLAERAAALEVPASKRFVHDYYGLAVAHVGLLEVPAFPQRDPQRRKKAGPHDNRAGTDVLAGRR